MQMEFVALIGRYNAAPAVALLIETLQRCTERYLSLTASTPETVAACVFEELFWAVGFAGYLLADSPVGTVQSGSWLSD